MAWNHFHPGDAPPDLLRYVQDQDLWHWALPDSEAVNAARNAGQNVEMIVRSSVVRKDGRSGVMLVNSKTDKSDARNGGMLVNSRTDRTDAQNAELKDAMIVSSNAVRKDAPSAAMSAA